MKKVLLILVAMYSMLASAQSGQSAVKLKDGTILKGIVKHIDPTDALTIEIAGMETQIKMSDIAEVEALREEQSQVIDPQQTEETPQLTVPKRGPKPGDPLNGYKGFLLAKGNNVYVYSEDGGQGSRGDRHLGYPAKIA